MSEPQGVNLRVLPAPLDHIAVITMNVGQNMFNPTMVASIHRELDKIDQYDVHLMTRCNVQLQVVD